MDTEVIQWQDGSWKPTPDAARDASLIAECVDNAEKLLQRSTTAILVSLDRNGLPFPKAMLIAKGSSLNCIRFSTNASSRHIAHIRENSTVSVYCYDPSSYEGIMLSGTAREEPDSIWRENIWEDGYEKSYSGFDDPDYFILRFDAEWGELLSQRLECHLPHRTVTDSSRAALDHLLHWYNPFISNSWRRI